MVAGRRGPAAGRVTAKGSTADGAVDPAFQRAILKIAIELRKPGARVYDAVVADTVRAMGLDARAFRRYLGENGARNMSLLLATARAAGI
jgi:hypothetical protein